MTREKLVAVFFTAVMLLVLAASAGAVDGTIEINQAKVLAAGPFPYLIGGSGSYRLTGNLVVPSGVDGLIVSANYVTIDLNGFSIIGDGGAVYGISASVVGTTVENGTITGFSQAGVYVGDDSIVKSVHVDSNTAGYGIDAGNNAVIEGCTANSNSRGINCRLSRCSIIGNTLNNNSAAGVNVVGSGSLILHNIIGGDAGGIFASDATTAYGENVFNGNTSNVSGGTSMKNNVCTGVIC